MAMNRPTGVSVTVNEPTYTSRLPFHPYIKLSARSAEYKMGVAVDPRIAFTEAGKQLFLDEMGTRLFSCICPDDMTITAMKLLDKLNWLHHHGELEIINHPIPHDPPLWEHDCDECVFLGTHHQHDLYYCQRGLKSLIARYGSLDHQYTSGLPLIPHDDNIWAAAVLAQVQGYAVAELIEDENQIMLVIDDKLVP